VIPEAAQALHAVDAWVVAILPALAIWFILSGLDDLAVDLIFAVRWLRGKNKLAATTAPARTEKKLAVFVPLWREHEVIEQMVNHNLSVIQYSNYELFIGAYPNDEDTLRAVGKSQERHPRVHLCVCPHDGPTSKADCLNWVLQHLFLYEQRSGLRFDAIVLHDAEDVIHPMSFALINEHLDNYDMVQIPVLPLPTPFHALTHAVYCDEFAESQWKDLRARVFAGGFLPSCGVGTALSRDCVERLAETYANRVFDPECLTEDYEIGLRVQRLGLKQIFTPLGGRRAIATREFFPQTFRGAVRQRTRWITGISLQSWQRNGWGPDWRTWYWLWRDRKGLAGNPLSVFANLLFVYGGATWAFASATGTPWGLANQVPALTWLALFFQVERIVTRSVCSAQVYGWAFAAGTPIRVLWANVINTVATAHAIQRFAHSRMTKTPLVWLKTEHAFPTMAALEEAASSVERKTKAAGAK
jgi:adsorption protein B